MMPEACVLLQNAIKVTDAAVHTGKEKNSKMHFLKFPQNGFVSFLNRSPSHVHADVMFASGIPCFYIRTKMHFRCSNYKITVIHSTSESLVLKRFGVQLLQCSK